MKENEPQLKKVFTVDEIMDMLKVKRLTVHDWIKEGKMKAVRIGRQLRIPYEFYKEFMDNNLVDNTKKK